MPHDVRTVGPTELAALSDLWHAGWHEAHAAHVPVELTRKRTLTSFRTRLSMAPQTARTIGPHGAPCGLCIVHSDEMNQLFVPPKARGTGVAQALLTDAEARIAASGARNGWLICLAENQSAVAFYQRCGWVSKGVGLAPVATLDGPFDLNVERFEKVVA